VGAVGGALAVFVPERLVLADRADVLPVLLQWGLAGGSARLRRVMLQDALESLIGRLRQVQHLLARALDVCAFVMACEVGEAVNGFLSGASQTREDFPGLLRAVRTDFGHFADQTRGFTGRVADAVLWRDLKMTFLERLSCRRRNWPR